MTLDYIDLAKLTDEKYFIEQAIALADSTKNVGNLLFAKRLMLIYYYYKEKNLQKSLDYLNSEPDLKKTFLNNGPGNYLQTIGNIYFYCNRPDSALIYYKLAQNKIIGTHDLYSSMVVLMQVASSYGKTGQTDSAIAYFKRAHDIAFEIEDVSNLAENAQNLSDLYNSKNDFKNAYFFLQQSQYYTDSLKSLSPPSDITLLGVERENKKHEQELLQIEKLENNKRNLQYMSITIAIVVVFFVMLIIGSYSISKTWVRVFGYFFFISLFEFIVLLIDNLFLTHAAHNQPLKIWLIKIGLIGMLAPFQHFLETNLIDFLASRKLVKARTNFSLKKSWAKIKKPSSHVEEGLEKDAAVM
jgi:tetratricopeptide (TPR) repeat protein